MYRSRIIGRAACIPKLLLLLSRVRWLLSAAWFAEFRERVDCKFFFASPLSIFPSAYSARAREVFFLPFPRTFFFLSFARATWFIIGSLVRTLCSSSSHSARTSFHFSPAAAAAAAAARLIVFAESDANIYICIYILYTECVYVMFPKFVCAEWLASLRLFRGDFSCWSIYIYIWACEVIGVSKLYFWIYNSCK